MSFMEGEHIFCIHHFCKIPLENISKNALISEDTRALSFLLWAKVFLHLCFYLFLCTDNGLTYRRSGTMLHSGDFIVIIVILVIEQETPPLYLWQGSNGTVEQFRAFLLNNKFLYALRQS